MKRFNVAGCFLLVAFLAGTWMYGLNAMMEQPVPPNLRTLFIGGGSSEHWQRTLAGAQAAAREFGVELQVVAPASGNSVAEQVRIIRSVNPTDYAAIAFSPADPASQIDLINELAGRTKLVTVGREYGRPKRMCNVAFCQANAGAMVAGLVRAELPRHGKIALLTTIALNVGQSVDVRERLEGFKQQWADLDQDGSLHCPLVDTAIDSRNLERAAQALADTLADRELAFIVAFDTNAAESAMRELAKLARRVPIIAFDPSAAILDAIDEGRVCSAIYEDPYRDGYEAIQRLSIYGRAEKTALPVPGLGRVPLRGEVVRKENLAEFRQRTQS
jgi:ribose transport system substrate-binding protein